MIIFSKKDIFKQIQVARWKDKVPKGLFRGRDSNNARLTLATLAQNNTDLFDVGRV